MKIRKGLTPRQNQIMELYYDGFSAQAVADKLVIALSTVKTQTSLIYAHYGITKENGFDPKVLALRKWKEVGGWNK
jgi:DNA-binding NarL/FixJ family response regulator